MKANAAAAALLAAACALGPGPARADEPLWELGAGLAGVRLPHYRGSDQNHGWLLPLPYAVYRGDIFRADRNGARAVLLDRPGVDLDLSAAATAPTRSRDDRARTGMPDLAPTLELGPNLNLTLAQGERWQVQLRLPVRAVFTAQRSPRAIGATFSPVLNLDWQLEGWSLGLQGGPQAATRAYHAYFYDVAPAYATADRPAYRAGGGAAGWHLGASASRRLGAWWVGSYVRVDSVAGAAFEPSPLVRQRSNLSFGLAVSRTLVASDQRVADRR